MRRRTHTLDHSVITPQPPVGCYQNSSGELCINFDPELKAQHTENGIMIPNYAFGGGTEGLIDNWTITKRTTNVDDKSLIDGNRDVVTCIFTMSRRKVTERKTIDSYTTSDETKTIEDVVKEFNAVMDAFQAIGEAIPDTLKHTQYIVKKGDFIQFRDAAIPFSMHDDNDYAKQWICATDDLRRYEDHPTLALFYVTNVEYALRRDPNYMTKLEMRCVWHHSSIETFVTGDKYIYPAPLPEPTPETDPEPEPENNENP